MLVGEKHISKSIKERDINVNNMINRKRKMLVRCTFVFILNRQ
jgi:hypothetical protein